MKLSGSSFYYKPRAKSPDRMKVVADLRDRIEAIYLEFPRYGYRRVTYQLKHEGWQINHKKVLWLVRESDLLCRVRRKWVKTTDSRHRSKRLCTPLALYSYHTTMFSPIDQRYHIDEENVPD